MRLGSDTGSLFNHLMAVSAAAPVVGMGATLLLWTDRHAYTVVWVSDNGKRLNACRDRAIRIDNNGMSDAQNYRYEKNPDSAVECFSLRKNGNWLHVGENRGSVLSLGSRREYYDHSF